MKVGDSVPVTIAGQVVGQAEITEMGDGKATLKVPGWWVVMGVKTELTDERGDVGGTSTVILGSEEKPVAPAEPAPTQAGPVAVTAAPETTVQESAPVAEGAQNDKPESN